MLLVFQVPSLSLDLSCKLCLYYPSISLLFIPVTNFSTLSRFPNRGHKNREGRPCLTERRPSRDVLQNFKRSSMLLSVMYDGRYEAFHLAVTDQFRVILYLYFALISFTVLQQLIILCFTPQLWPSSLSI